MTSLSMLGTIHTAISLAAVIAGFVAVLIEGGIGWKKRAGRNYIIATLLTCLTAFGIFQHGGFGKPHALAVVTLVVLAVGLVLDARSRNSRAALYGATIAYSTTLFLHMIPGVTETFTRLPTDAPLFASPDDPALQHVIGAMAVVYIVGVVVQLVQLRRRALFTHSPA